MRSLEAMRQPAEQEERQEPAAEEGTNAHLSIYYPYDQFNKVDTIIFLQ